ncbi:MAG: iron-containing alcohol dehydrogenase [Planctomycetaceae bacterium]|nr:iron-containing alcohol dehydrogenase [Planctomycetaceae bacterium]
MSPFDHHSSSVGDSSSPLLNSFDYQPRTRVVFGCGVFGQLGDLAAEFGSRCVLLVTDRGLRAVGHADRAAEILQRSGIDVALYDHVHENPTTDDVDACVKFASGHNVDLIIGLGGGSSMDCAKGTNFLLTNGGRMHDYRGVGKAKKPMLPMIAVPTTAGTGSEAQSFAVIADAETHMKMPCGDPRAACRVAVLDPELTVTMPRSVAAATGIDAMTHAIESYVTTRRNPISQMFARQAWLLLSRSFTTVLQEPGNLAARGDMQLGAMLAGAAIENSMLGAAHACANPLTARFPLIHGIAVGVMLPHVIRWNSVTVADLYRDLAVAAGWCESTVADGTAAGILADRFREFLDAAQMPDRLSVAVDTPLDDPILEELAAGAAQQWTGTFNPRKMDAAGFKDLYRNAG